MTPPLLKLLFAQGPRDGDSLEYQPGSTVRIGRILRGNEIAIKEAGISTKHLQIVSDSDNWIIRDLGSSNGTILNSETLEPDTPVNLRHGDVIKLGEYTSILVNFVTGIQTQEHKLPPKPRRNNRRLNVADTDPDPVPIEPVKEKPTRRGRPKKQDNASSKEDEIPKRTRASRSRALDDDDIADEEKQNEEVVNSRVMRSRKKEEKEVATITKEEVTEEEKIQNLGLKSVKMEIEDIPKKVEISGMTRATRNKQIENASSGMENAKREDTALEEKRISRATRSKKNEKAGDCFLELEMVLHKARKNRAKGKKKEEESRNDEVEKEDEEEEKDDDKEVETSKKNMEARNDEVEKEDEEEKEKNTLEEEDKSSTGREDGEKEEKVKEESSKKSLEKMTLGEWFDFMEVQLRKQIIEETDKLIEPMRSKAMRVHKYIQEQKQANGQASLN